MPQSSPKPAPNPETESTAAVAARIKSLIRNTFLASPEFPRLYADVVISSAPNSNEAKILARNYKKIVERTQELVRQNAGLNLDRTNLNSTNRTNMPNPRNCTHIRVTGVRCGSPALRGEQFCYFHQRMLRTVKGPPNSRVHHAALLEDEESIQASLMEVVNALLRGSIELKRAELILRALNTAVRNIRRVNFAHASHMVTRVPDYPAAPDIEVEEAARAQAARQATRAEIAQAYAAHLETTNVQTAQVTTAHVGTANVGTAAPGCPGGPEVPGRSAVPPNPTPNKPPEVTMRKPPVSVKPAAPKERKIAARGASRG
jgi:hypothetical protein